MSRLNGTTTLDHLLAAFARESQANRRYLWFAQQADVEGRPEAAAAFRIIADGETGHALDLLDFLADVGDPVTGGPIGDTDDNLAAALAGETNDAVEGYERYAAVARDEGLGDVADFFEALTRAEARHAERLRRVIADGG